MTKKSDLDLQEAKPKSKPATKPRTSAEQNTLAFDLIRTEEPCKKSTCCENKTRAPLTRIVIQYNVGFGNSIFLRGKGADLSWDKGTPLKNTKDNEWVWETESTFPSLEFKVLINDSHYENGDNHHLTYGTTIHYTPKF